MIKQIIKRIWDFLSVFWVIIIPVIAVVWLFYSFFSSEIFLQKINKDPVLTTGTVTKSEYVDRGWNQKGKYRSHYTYFVRGTEYSGKGFVYDHNESIKIDPGTKIKIIYKKSDPSKSVIADPEGKVPL